MPSPTKKTNLGSQIRGHKAQPSPRKTTTQSYKTQGMLFGDLCPVEYNEELDPPVKACFNCWSFKHQRKHCTLPKTYNYCCNCGRKGLTVEECPRCARTFHAMDDGKKGWIYRRFFNTDSNQEQTPPKKRSQQVECCDDYYDEKRMMQKKDSRGEEYGNSYDESHNRQSPSVESHVKTNSAKSKMNKLKDEDFTWELSKSYHSLETAYAEPHVLFDYMRHKKIMNELQSAKMGVNLNETRMAEMDSLDENSVLSIENDKDSPKKDQGLLHLPDDPIRNLLRLLKAVEHLSVSTQDIIVVQYVDERKQMLAAKGYPNLLKSQ